MSNTQLEHQVTPEEANEILDAAEAGYSVEIWNGKGLTIVNPALDGTFDFTIWPTYRAGVKAQEANYERGDAWLRLITFRTTGINV